MESARKKKKKKDKDEEEMEGGEEIAAVSFCTAPTMHHKNILVKGLNQASRPSFISQLTKFLRGHI